MKKLILSLITVLLSTVAFSQPGLFLPNFSSSGSLGTAAATYETNALVHIAQTTPGVVLTVSTPSNVLASKNFTIANNGTVVFRLIPGGNVEPGTGVIYRWDGVIFEVTGAGGMSASQPANRVLVSPNGSSGYPEFRSLVLADLPSIPLPVTYYNGSGTQTITKVWTATITPSTGNGHSIDISSAGFSNVVSAIPIAIKNTATVTSVPNISIKSKSTTAIVINITEANPATTTILGIPVLSGAPTVFANTSGLTVDIVVYGN